MIDCVPLVEQVSLCLLSCNLCFCHRQNHSSSTALGWSAQYRFIFHRAKVINLESWTGDKTNKFGQNHANPTSYYIVWCRGYKDIRYVEAKTTIREGSAAYFDPWKLAEAWVFFTLGNQVESNGWECESWWSFDWSSIAVRTLVACESDVNGSPSYAVQARSFAKKSQQVLSKVKAPASVLVPPWNITCTGKEVNLRSLHTRAHNASWVNVAEFLDPIWFTERLWESLRRGQHWSTSPC
jgi:hypothetical protein